MEMEEFKTQFITEAKEKLSEAVECLNSLENDYNENRLVALKRSFHTLKGNSAAMGFQKYFELAKACNDLTQKVIEKEVELNSDVISILQEGQKKLLEGIDLIEKDNPESLENEELLDRIKSF